ncbi:MAG: DUF554 domain-containing protein [Clostridia bacterium]|nr:DUF554 domain-containing protein [Clostridia bacterium]
MSGLGTIVNIILVIIGSLLGLLLKKAIPEKLKTSVTQALALATFSIGMTGVVTAACNASKDGTLASNYTIIMVLSLAIGTIIGEIIDIDKRLNTFGDKLQLKFRAQGSFGEGFVTASLIFCVGSMAILGSLQDGIMHDPTILITKSLLDGIMSIVLASTLGIGVIFSIFTVGIYQGLITLCAAAVSPFLTTEVISQMSFIGSILIMGIGINFVYSPKLKLSNMLPSMFIPLIYYIVKTILGGII